MSDRARPWRRSGSHAVVPPLLGGLLATYLARRPKADLERLTEAYKLAELAHRGQTRRTGEAYINHPVAVARIVANLGLDETTVVVSLIHDVVEDTTVSLGDVEKQFGAEVAMLVDGVTKLERLRFDSKEEQQAATMRKMLVAMARDARVLIIKLADRLHNMRTLAALPADKQERIAAETLDIYAPLAHRLGMQEIRQELEDLAFAVLHPKRYAEIDDMVVTRTPEREAYVGRVITEVRSRLVADEITAEVTGRGKHLWSIWEKMQLKGKAFDDIFDLVGIRVLVADKSACYAALGVIHAAYTPVLGRFKDYVAMPKFNQYQSLHTTVVGPEGKSLEVQIRSHEMHLRAEKGVASHWVYKGGSTDELAWITRLAGSDADRRDPAIWLEELKSDLEPNEVFVYTPKGEVLQLPLGSTPVDFAYAVHTEVGHRCIGARVNGRLVPLDHKLRSGETCEVVLRKGGNGGGPSRDWLSYVGSPRAANKIKQWFSRERRDDSLDSGREAVISGLRRENAPVHRVMATESLDRHAVAMGYADGESLLVAVGEHHVTAKAVIQRLTRDSRVADADEVVPPRTPAGRPRRPRGEIGIHVDGLDDMMVKIARCCLPVPGDEVMGFVTRGRGVSVHRSDCSNAVALGQSQPVRVIDVEWDEQASLQHFTVSVEIHAYDRPGLLRDVSGMLAEHQLNILGCSTSTDGDRISVMRFEIELADPAHLSAVLRSLKGIDGVFDAYRWVPTTHPAGVR